MENDVWYVTFRHTSQRPIDARIYRAASQEAAQQLQGRMMDSHESAHCGHCAALLGQPGEHTLGRAEFVVSRIRTKREINNSVDQWNRSGIYGRIGPLF